MNKMLGFNKNETEAKTENHADTFKGTKLVFYLI